MTQELMPLPKYQSALDQHAQRAYPEVEAARKRMLVEATGHALKHFLERPSYGSDPRNVLPHMLPTLWPYVRYMVSDIFRAKFTNKPIKYADARWTDSLLNDLTDEAWEIARMVPEDIQQQEWLFMVEISAYMLMQDPLLVECGYINESGRQNLIMQSLAQGGSDKDIYEEWWDDKVGLYFDGFREESTPEHL